MINVRTVAAALLIAALWACSNPGTLEVLSPTTPAGIATVERSGAPPLSDGQSPHTVPGGTPTGAESIASDPSELPLAPAFSSSPPSSSFLDAPGRDLYRLAIELTPGAPQDVPRVVNPAPATLLEGAKETFWLVDGDIPKLYQSEFELRLVTPHAYWYVEQGQEIEQRDLERSASRFEDDIYPRVTGAFGSEWLPGVDGDVHLNIVNAGLKGAGGYYSSRDEFLRSVSPFSNQREMIYINTDAFPVGSGGYLKVLAHELQHAIHWNADQSEDAWLNEGLSELAISVAGYGAESIYRFLQARPTSLINWPQPPRDNAANYGASSLFMHYLAEHFGTQSSLRLLLNEPGNGIAGIDAYLQDLGYNVTFNDVFRDWAVANLLDQDQGVYGYKDLQVSATILKFIDEFSDFSSEIPQYSVEYVELASFVGPLRLRFHGSQVNSLLPVDVGPEGCWWSNSGDSINSTLTGAFDLKDADQAALGYQVWYSLEPLWDYAYVEVSSDGGRKWDILETRYTTSENPVGNSYGHGYTGDSGRWITEFIDLGAYTGREILIRFQYITDDAFDMAGLCLRQIAVYRPELVQLDDVWQADGFVLTDNRVRQSYIVQVVEIAEEPRVTVVSLDETNSGELVVSAPEKLDRLVVIVAALAPKTKQAAPYTLTVEPAG